GAGEHESGEHASGKLGSVDPRSGARIVDARGSDTGGRIIRAMGMNSERTVRGERDIAAAQFASRIREAALSGPVSQILSERFPGGLKWQTSFINEGRSGRATGQPGTRSEGGSRAEGNLRSEGSTRSAGNTRSEGGTRPEASSRPEGGSRSAGSSRSEGPAS